MTLSFVTLAVILACSGLVQSQLGWWSLGVSNCAVSGSCYNQCTQLEGAGILSPTQKRKCSDDSEAVRAVAKGTRQAIIECQSRFENRKWTCSAVTSQDSQNLFGSFIREKRTRETAVLFAFLVAGATQKLAQFCQEGRIEECTCSPTVQYRDSENNIIFEKCDENITWASGYIQNFTALPYKDLLINDTRSEIDQHNINVGTKAVGQLERFCTCHGISGTCTVQTCYNRVPTVNEVGETLYLKYDGAVKVDSTEGQLERVDNPQADPLKKSDLVFLDESPDLCKNSSEGVQGTQHRECDPSLSSTKSCSVLCCGRGYYTVTEMHTEKDCAFVYCCYFDCETRNVTTTTHRCKP